MLVHPGLHRTLRFAFALLLALSSETAMAICIGDCNADGAVTVEEIVSGVDIALGDAPTACANFDDNIDREVTVDELLQGVTNALDGCPAPPPAAPALRASGLPIGGQLVRTEWIKLIFAAPLDPQSLAGFELKCDGLRHAVHMFHTDAATAVANPSPELPPDA